MEYWNTLWNKYGNEWSLLKTRITDYVKYFVKGDKLNKKWAKDVVEDIEKENFDNIKLNINRFLKDYVTPEDEILEVKTLQHASDGIHFRKVASFGDDYPKAPGSLRVGNFEDASQQNTGISWGISMFYGSKGQWPHLLKYEINIE